MKKNIFYGWRVVFSSILIMAVFFGFGFSGSLLYVAPICETFNFSIGQFAINLSMLSISMSVGSLLCGKIIKNIGIKKTILIGAIVLILGQLAMAFANKLYLFTVASALVGTGTGMAAHVPVTSLIVNWFEKRRGFLIGLVISAASLGSSIASPLLINIIHSYSYQLALVLTAVLIGIVSIPILFLVKDKPEDIGLRPYGQEELSNDNKNNNNNNGLTLKEARKLPSFTFMLICTLGILTALVSVSFYVPTFLNTKIDPLVVGTILSVMYLMKTVGKLLMGVISDKFGIRTCIVYGTILFVISMGVALNLNAPIMGYVFAICYGLSFALTVIITSVLITTLFGQKDYSSIFSIVQGVSVFCSGIMTIVIGMVYDVLGSYNLLFSIITIIAIVSAISGLLAIKMKPKHTKRRFKAGNTLSYKN